jgi:hypothetical protein
MKGWRRIKPWRHFRGEKSSQIDEEKIQQHLSKVKVDLAFTYLLHFSVALVELDQVSLD